MLRVDRELARINSVNKTNYFLEKWKKEWNDKGEERAHLKD